MATAHPVAATKKDMVCALEPEPPVLLALVVKKDDRDSGSLSLITPLDEGDQVGTFHPH